MLSYLLFWLVKNVFLTIQERKDFLNDFGFVSFKIFQSKLSIVAGKISKKF